MTTVWVVPAFDVFKDRHASLSLSTEYAPLNEFAFKGSEKALRHRVGVSRRLHPIQNSPPEDSRSPILSIHFAAASSN